MGIYYTIHFIIFFACLFENLRRDSDKRKVMWLLMIMVTCFGGLRWQIGGDWDQYYDHFLASDYSNMFNYERHNETLEPLFVFFNATIRYIFGTFWAYNLIVVGFIQYTYYKMSWHFSPQSPIMFYAFLMVLCSNYFPVRAGFSLGIAFWVYKFLSENKYWTSIILIVIAFNIHRQCIALIPLLFVPFVSRWLNFGTASLLYLSFAVLGYVFRDYFVLLSMAMGGDVGSMAEHYTSYENEGHQGLQNSYIGWALNYFFLCIYFYVRKKLNLQSDINYNILIAGVLIYDAITMVFTEGGMSQLTRLSRLFVFPQVILYIYSMTYFLQQKGRNSYQKYFAILFYIAYYLYRMTKIDDGFYFEETCLPYKTIFDYNIL